MSRALNISAVQSCTRCITLGACHVPAEGNAQAQVMFIGQSPGATEVEEGRPFCGPSGEILDFFLDEAGLDRASVYITNALKCHPPGNRAGHPEELTMCLNTWLTKELKSVNPSIIVLLGKDAWQSVTHGRIPFGHGLVTKTKTKTFLTLYHPAYFLRRGDVESFVTEGKKLKELYADSNQ